MLAFFIHLINLKKAIHRKGAEFAEGKHISTVRHRPQRIRNMFLARESPLTIYTLCVLRGGI